MPKLNAKSKSTSHFSVASTSQASTSSGNQGSKPSTSFTLPLSSSSPSQSTTPARARASESNFQVQVLCTLQRLEEGVQQLTQLIQKLFLSKSGVAVDVEDLREPFTQPVDTEDEFEALASKLVDVEFRKKMIRYLSLVGGGDVNQTVRRVLKKLGTNSLWSHFNVLGRKGKRGMKTTAFFPVIVRACIKNHVGAKESEIEEVVGDYLKRTPFLPGGSKYMYKVNPPTRQDAVIEEAVIEEAVVVQALDDGEDSAMEN
ncbi:uncharacterized protein LOC115928253 [Strongylocentrotus purpuratus]|uniref:DUF4806 domain-containing protein n=1 Tax=Strongylocentrotus purpuratus TaxID=7668 RepID=A0A7M7PHZ4_STRPU|nr:uncharacterized protein LOC115928253 [Strongylocentrotus purpuratus]XP_030851177.1 uncharacterized protein LOC115928253 [Strongylocentrotus purpuratus]